MAKKMPVSLRDRVRVQCSGCGNCCSDTVVPITMQDLKRLIAATGMDPDNIVTMYDNEEIAYGEESEGWVRLASGMRVMGIRKINDRCRFLTKDRRCRVYFARPMTCRTFPLEVVIDEEHDEIKKIALIEGVNCKHYLGSRLSLSWLGNNARKEDAEDIRYFEKLERWNRRKKPGNKREFLEYIVGKKLRPKRKKQRPTKKRIVSKGR